MKQDRRGGRPTGHEDSEPSSPCGTVRAVDLHAVTALEDKEQLAPAVRLRRNARLRAPKY